MGLKPRGRAPDKRHHAPAAVDWKALAEALKAAGVPADVARQVASSKNTRALARALFLVAAWQLVIDEEARTPTAGEPAWIESWLRWPRSQNIPPTGIAAALARMLAAGIDPDDLTDVVRAMQLDVLINLCSLLDMEGLEPIFDRAPALRDAVAWRLCASAPDDAPPAAIESLHESVYHYDPTGRDGEPRNR